MKKKRAGVITVEATLVMPIVMGVILLLYSVIVIQYNNVIFRTAAIRTTNRIGANWNQIGGDGYSILKEDMKTTEAEKSGKNVITSASYADNDPYEPIFQVIGAGKKQRASNIDTYYNYMLGQAIDSDFNLFNMSIGGGEDSDYQFWEMIIGGTFDITVINEYNHGLLNVIEKMGYDLNRLNSATVKASYNDPVEFVRNIGFAKDMIDELKKKEEEN